LTIFWENLAKISLSKGQGTKLYLVAHVKTDK